MPKFTKQELLFACVNNKNEKDERSLCKIQHMLTKAVVIYELCYLEYKYWDAHTQTHIRRHIRIYDYIGICYRNSKVWSQYLIPIWTKCITSHTYTPRAVHTTAAARTSNLGNSVFFSMLSSPFIYFLKLLPSLASHFFIIVSPYSLATYILLFEHF